MIINWGHFWTLDIQLSTLDKNLHSFDDDDVTFLQRISIRSIAHFAGDFDQIALSILPKNEEIFEDVIVPDAISEQGQTTTPLSSADYNTEDAGDRTSGLLNSDWLKKECSFCVTPVQITNRRGQKQRPEI